jgi:hypothetical protein
MAITGSHGTADVPSRKLVQAFQFQLLLPSTTPIQRRGEDFAEHSGVILRAGLG